MKMNGSKVYAAIRETEGKMWIDVSSVNVLPELTRSHAEAFDRKIPDWAAVNRFVRIAELHLSEAAPVETAPAPAVKPKAKRKGEPIIIDGLDCTLAIQDMKKAQTGFACPNSWLANPAAFRRDKRAGERIAAAMDTAEKHGESVTLKCDDGGTIIVRRRAS
jgi:hypothetical protein